MKEALLDILICPDCKGALTLEDPVREPEIGEILDGTLRCIPCDHVFPIDRGIPCLITDAASQKDIAGSFMQQWRLRKSRWFEKKHLYGRSLDDEIRQFFQRLGLHPEDLKGKRILDAGCGSGRMIRALSTYGCEVVGIDLSDVRLAYSLNKGTAQSHVLLADIFRLPFPQETFDIVWSEGVIHHTPDPQGAFRCLADVTKPGGTCYVWVYGRSPQERLRRLLKTPRLPRFLAFLLSYALVLPYAVWQACRILFRYRSTAFAFFDALTHIKSYEWRVVPFSSWLYKIAHNNVLKWFREQGKMRTV